MRKLTASFFISLDGVVEAPQNWDFPYFDDEMERWSGESIAASAAFLLGRRTYEESMFWPHQDPAENPMASAMNETQKFVVSTSLEKVEWQNSTLLESDLAEAVTEAESEARQEHRHVRECHARALAARGASSTSCACSSIRSSRAARSSSRTARRQYRSESSTRGRFRTGVVDLTYRPGGWMRPPGGAIEGRHFDRLRQRGRRACAASRRRGIQLPPLQELDTARRAARAALPRHLVRPARARRQRRRARVRRCAGDRGSRRARPRGRRPGVRVWNVVRRRAGPSDGCRRRPCPTGGRLPTAVQRRR